MKNLKQWITWNLIPVGGQIKPAKVPFCFKTNRKINAHDPANWMTFTEAKVQCENVGFVLTPNDPYFCIDLDSCAVNGEWSQFSKDVMTWFPGAYVEVSYSQNGLHIFGKYDGVLPEHKSKVKFGQSSLELYSTGRFIAYTEIHCSGDCNTDCTVNLNKYINQYMVPDHNQNNGPMPVRSSEKYGGFLKPDPEWLGPEDDDELLRRMLKSKKSVNSHLNGKATFKDLWENNVEVLEESYPDPTGKHPYDRSSADMSLFLILAFWTGRNGPRMERIARKSALKRDKWDEHKDYLSGANYTIHKVCLKNTDIYQDPKLLVEKTAKASGNHNYLITSQFLPVNEQVEYFDGCVYILDRNCIFTPEQGVLKPEQFNSWYGGKIFAMTIDGKTVTKKPFEVFTLSQGYTFPKVSGSCFRPEHKKGEIIDINELKYVNTYIPVKTAYAHGNVEPLIFLSKTLFKNKIDWKNIMSYGASANQNPGVKFRWCPVIQGVQGNGKSLFMKCIAYGIGEKFVFYPQANDIGNKFNSFMDGKLMIIVDEVDTFNKLEMINALKPLITNDRIAIQAKGVDTIMTDNRANFMMATNHKNAVSKTKNDRRYAIFYTAQQEMEDLVRDGLTPEFFKYFMNWYDNENGNNNAAGYLQNFQIEDAFNPAILSLVAPQTSSTNEAIQTSKSIVYQEIKEAIEQGTYGFRGDWISSYALTMLLESKRLVKFLPLSKRKAMLAELGYIPMPWVANGRASGQLACDGNTRPILYVKESLRYSNPLTTDDYVNAQAENNKK